MNWFKKLVIKWVREDWDNANKSSRPEMLVASRDVESISDGEPILNFRVFSAVGGRVVEFRHYDRQKDRNHTTTYIITNEQDFGERIAKIVTMESLKS
jgi:hypothetical protein